MVEKVMKEVYISFDGMVWCFEQQAIDHENFIRLVEIIGTFHCNNMRPEEIAEGLWENRDALKNLFKGEHDE